ncbi:hypothetical protein C5167_018532 [Papaver somniferum]|uniref:Uncharacterized protein n=1 Tax=Papaver somniferum TaxID=3469 RepID=A0A4Y7IN46_PAPSO|nr:hypothetical protein C5167_018532 [Papaver somniferum]
MFPPNSEDDKSGFRSDNDLMSDKHINNQEGSSTVAMVELTTAVRREQIFIQTSEAGEGGAENDQLGDGSKTLIRQDIWIMGEDAPPISIALDEMTSQYTTVSDLIDAENKSWRAQVILALFQPNIAANFFSMRIPINGEDGLIWTLRMV